MNKEIMNFIKGISKDKSYGLSFLKFYKEPISFFGIIDSEFEEAILDNEKYFPFWLNSDFIKILKLCLIDEDFIKKLSSEICFNLVCFLDHMIIFKKGYSKSAEECASLEIEPNMRRQDIEAYALQKLHFEKYRKIFGKVSEEMVSDFDEQELEMLKIHLRNKGKFIFNNYEKAKSQKVAIYNFIAQKGLNNLSIELEDETFCIYYNQGQLSITNELIYAFVCENKFLSVVIEFLRNDEVHNENVLMSIYKILELGIMHKENKFEINDSYEFECESLIEKEKVKKFDSSLARTLMDSITKILLSKERNKAKNGFVLLRGQKES